MPFEAVTMNFTGKLEGTEMVGVSFFKIIHTVRGFGSTSSVKMTGSFQLDTFLL